MSLSIKQKTFTGEGESGHLASKIACQKLMQYIDQAALEMGYERADENGNHDDTNNSLFTMVNQYKINDTKYYLTFCVTDYGYVRNCICTEIEGDKNFNLTPSNLFLRQYGFSFSSGVQTTAGNASSSVTVHINCFNSDTLKLLQISTGSPVTPEAGAFSVNESFKIGGYNTSGYFMLYSDAVMFGKPGMMAGKFIDLDGEIVTLPLYLSEDTLGASTHYHMAFDGVLQVNHDDVTAGSMYKIGGKYYYAFTKNILFEADMSAD